MVSLQHPVPGSTVNLLVKSIAVFEESADEKTVLPFFADGYPGLVFYESKNGLTIRPHSKRMPQLFLYGQTVNPVELVFHGSFKLIICQLYPFVLRSLFRVDVATLTNNCHDPVAADAKAGRFLTGLQSATTVEERLDILCRFLYYRFEEKKEDLDFKIKQAIGLIIGGKGQQNVGTVTDALKINPRTFERRFRREVGIGAKQFSNIIRFQQSFLELNAEGRGKLTDVVYGNGYADQSHFIKVFKAFATDTPSVFLKKQAR